MAIDQDPTLGATAPINANPLESPSHVFGAVEAEIDEGLVHISLRASEFEAPKRPQLSEGEVLGGLALLSLFGAEKIRRARAASTLNRLIQSRKAANNQDIIQE